jgi:hypothetical protein
MAAEMIAANRAAISASRAAKQGDEGEGGGGKETEAGATEALGTF